MGKLLYLVILMVVSSVFEPVFAQSTASKQTGEAGIEAYYFHNTRRCMTCNKVEEVTKESLKALYGDKITLKSLVFEDQKNKKIVEKYKVEGQSLFLVKGDKKIDITNDAFMNAVRRPEKLKEKIQETVASLN
jgi:hypothetical protein